VHISVSKDRITALKRVGIATLLLIVSDAIGHRIIKVIFDRPRPCNPGYFINGVHVLFPQCNFLIGQKGSLSFPSNHAITNSALALIWSLWFPKAAFVLVPLAAFFIFTLVYCGVHYPLALFFGAIFGAGFGYAAYFYTKPLLTKKLL
jgi:undecaprenyl-diphosphatase